MYPYNNFSLRIDDSFRLQINKKHHNTQTALLSFEPNVEMIYNFILDFLHLGCQGRLEKLLKYLVPGPDANSDKPGEKRKLSPAAKKSRQKIRLYAQQCKH